MAEAGQSTPATGFCFWIAGSGDGERGDGDPHPAPQASARGRQLGGVARKHEEVQREAADDDSQRDQPEPAAGGRQHERRSRHFTLKAKSPSVR